MPDLINLGGSPVKKSQLDHLTFNRAFLYGEGFFETMRKSNGAFPLWHYHWSRIEKSAQFFGMDRDSLVNKESLHEHLISSTATHDNASVKILFYTEGTGKYAGSMKRLRCIINAKPLHSPSPIWPENGLIVDYSERSIIPAGAPYGFVKKTSALPYVIADREKEERELDELLLLNTDGDIAESIYHNVFIYKDKTYITPPLSSGCVQGTARALIIDHLKSNNQNITEQKIDKNAIQSAEEVFLTNGLRIIQPVKKIGKSKTLPIRKSVTLFNNICENLFLQKDLI